MTVGQMMRSSPAGWSRPAVKRQQGARRPVNAAVRGRDRAFGSWMRLWFPEGAAVLWAAVWLVVLLRPVPTVPLPVGFFTSPADVQAWWRSLVWRSTGDVVFWWRVVASVVGAVFAVDMRLLRSWRLARRLRWRWEKAARRDLGSVPRLRRIRVRGGVVDALIVTRRHNWDAIRAALDLDRGEMLAKLRLNRRLGSPFRATIVASGHRNPARTRSLRLYYVPLGLPDTFPMWEEPVRDERVFVGWSVDGPVFADLSEAPHMQYVGDTGTGKGQSLALANVQCLRAGWLGGVIDGGTSPEYAVLDAAPTFLRPMRVEMTAEAKLSAALTLVALYKAMADARSAIVEAFGVGRWQDLPPDVLAWLPPMWLVLDEITKLLSPSKDAKLDALRKALATALDTDGLRNGRKFGLHIFMADQFAYSDVFSRGTQRQASNVVVLGNLGGDQVRQITGLSDGLPSVPEVPRCGHFVRFGNPNIREIRVPFDSGALRRAVAYVVERTGGRS